jgi:hypothetical protein
MDFTAEKQLKTEKRRKKRESSMSKFRKLPVTIEAIQFKDDADVLFDISEFANDTIRINYDSNPKTIKIPTLEGEMTANEGDWIIKGVNGEFYPCKPYIFNKTYESIPQPIPNPNDSAFSLKDTIDMMNSEDFKERFRAEYFQLCIRTNGLRVMLDKMTNKTLPFAPKCSLGLLSYQHSIMKQYLKALEERAEIEGINLDMEEN